MASKDYTERKYSLSAEGETPKKYGNFNTYSEDVAYQPTDVAPTAEAEVVAENTTANEQAEAVNPEPAPLEIYEQPTHNRTSYKVPFFSLAAVFVAVLALVVYLNIEHQSNMKLSDAAYTELERDYNLLLEKYSDTKDDYYAQKSKYDKIIDEYEFYKYCAVCVNENDPYYHSYTCSHFDTSYFWIYNIEAAKGKGYDPCPDCRLNEQ